MNIQAKKLELVQMILNNDKPAVLEKIARILESEESDWRDGLPAEIIESVERGILQSRSGNTISHEQVLEKYSKWLSK